MHFSCIHLPSHVALLHLTLCSLMLLLPTLSTISSLSICPSHCFCDSWSRFVNCSGLNLSSLLVLPPLDTEFLDLSSCSLQSLPPLHSLWRLRTLILTKNRVLEAGAKSWRGLQSLQNLDLSGNRITELSVSFSWGLESLTHLLLDDNLLHTLPALCFQHLNNLEILDLQGNLISHLESGVLRPLTQLRRLQLQNNLLQSLQSDDFSVLQRLEFLDLSGNQIKYLPPGIFAPLHSLTFLNLQQNHLRHLRFQVLQNLPAPGTLLLLSSNPWECDCDLQRVFGKLGAVQRLSLMDSGEMSCAEPPALRGRPLTSLDTRLCVAETVTVLVISLTISVTVIGAIVAAERSRKKSPRSRESEMHTQD